MFSYLTGTLAAVHRPSGHRHWLTLEVSGIGYEVQITSRFGASLPPLASSLQVYCHLQVKDDQWTLFGFGEAAHRDLFRQLIAVNGVGPQMAMALLDTLAPADLVQAVVGNRPRLLAQAPGVGTKIAERLILELKTKLADWRQQAGLAATDMGGILVPVQEEVEGALLALGYSASELNSALQAISRDATLAQSQDPEAWIRAAIAWLSQG